MDFALRDEILAELPTMRSGPSSRRRRLTAQEIDQLLVACVGADTADGARDAGVIALFATSGIRICELSDLRLEDWDQESGVINIRMTKNGHSHVVFLHEAAVLFLAHWIARRGTTPGWLWVAPGKHGSGKAPSTDTVRGWVDRRRQQAQLAKFGTHDFRRTVASTLLRTHDISLVSKILGHLSVESTLVYDLAFEDELRAAIASLQVAPPPIAVVDDEDEPRSDDTPRAD